MIPQITCVKMLKIHRNLKVDVRREYVFNFSIFYTINEEILINNRT